MKREERIAKAFLKAYFGIEPVYEPLGHGCPPDFQIGSTVFEVRRLNENYIREGGKPEGLEQASYSLNKAVLGELGDVPFSSRMGSFFVGLRFARPLRAKPGKIARELAKKARLHYSSASRVRQTITASGVTAELIPASTARGRAFVPGFEVDDESGGLLGEIYRNNIQVALEEKISKTRKLAQNFDRWVLLLVDSIAPGTSWLDEVGAMTLDLQHFNSVAIINPDGSLEVEWPRNSLKRVARNQL